MDCIVNDKKPSPDFADAAKINAVLDAMTKSSNTRSWVKVPEVEI
jgi:predicted dehydrogenase